MRETLANLVTRTRRLVGDPACASQYFEDDQIQDALDEQRWDVTYTELRPRPTYAQTLAAQWLDYYDPAYGGNWEDDIAFCTGGYVPLTPDVVDNIVGHWTFAVSQPPPVMIVFGKTFDIYAAAGDLVEQRASAVMLDFDVTSDKQAVLRSQKHAMLTAQAQKLRAKSRPRTIRGSRSDSRPQRLAYR